MSIYAKDTVVPIERSKTEIERILMRYGADQFGYISKTDRAVIQFSMKKKMLRFDLPLPTTADASEAYVAKESRRRWRSLSLVIKAKLEAVDSGITQFEAEFLAHIVLPNKQTVAEYLLPQVEAAYLSGQVPAMLEWGGEKP